MPSACPASNAATRSDKGRQGEIRKGEPLRYGHIEIKGAYPEGAEPISLFGNAVETLADAVGRLDKVADDEKLNGVILRINDPTLGWAKVNELRQAIQRIRHKGKRSSLISIRPRRTIISSPPRATRSSCPSRASW